MTGQSDRLSAAARHRCPRDGNLGGDGAKDWNGNGREEKLKLMQRGVERRVLHLSLNSDFVSKVQLSTGI